MRTTYGLVLGLVGMAAAARGSISQATSPNPGGFIQAGAYASSIPGIIPGADMSPAASADFEEHSFTNPGSTAADAAYSGGQVSNSSSGTAGMGYLRMHAFNSGPNSTSFSGGEVNGCWKDTFTVSNPGLNGQAGYMVFQVRGRGTLSANGFAGLAGIHTTGYKNNQELMLNALFNRGNSDAISTDRQRAQWGAASAPNVTRTVDGVVTMAVPITFGTPFSLSVCAMAQAGQRSQSGVTGLSNGTVDFTGQGITWNGIVSITNSAMTPVTGSSIISGSGIDWGAPVLTCDSIDFNGDGLYPDTADVDDFLSVFSGGPCSTGTCGDIDFNNDGLFPDTSDIDSLLNVFSGGACL